MSHWILIFYMSMNTFSSLATGGPGAVSGLKSEAQCKAVLSELEKMRKFDWGQCIEVKP
jgi:hypothetical protein